MSAVHSGWTPSALNLILLADAAQQMADHGDRNVVGEIIDEIAAALGFQPVEQAIDQILGIMPQPCHYARREIGADDAPHPGVIRRVQEG
jgi:hypothetical protein